MTETCQDCDKELSPMEAEDSYDATYNGGITVGRYLCRKHLDRFLRNRDKNRMW